MGSHRSGTTWLSQLLAETGRFDYLTAYHVIAYDMLPEPSQAPSMEEACRELLVTMGLYQGLVAKFEQLDLHQRSFDEVAISPSTPEEYGFIFANAGAGLRIGPRNLHLFAQLCAKLKTAGESRPLVLKNPWDYSNFLYIKKVLPRARFLFIQRHPERVIHSYLQAARNVLAVKDRYVALLSRAYDNLFDDSQKAKLFLTRLLVSRRMDLGVRLAATALAVSHRYYLKNIHALSRADYLSLRYEDLCERPQALLAQILTFAGVDAPLETAKSTPSKPRPAQLLPEIERRRAEIRLLMGPYMQLHGYS